MKRLFVGLPLLLAFATVTALSCVATYRGISPDPQQLHYPIGIAVHPSGRFLYVANSNFDLGYTGGSLMVFSTEENKTVQGSIQGIKTDFKSLTILPQATVEIGSFVGQMLINREGTELYLPIRNDRREDRPIDLSSITVVRIDPSKDDHTHLSCDQKPVIKEETGGVGVEGKYDTEPAPRCGDKSKIFIYGKRCKTDQDCPLNLLPTTTITATTAAAANNPVTQNQTQTQNQFERCLKDDGAEIGYCATNFYPYTMSILSACLPKRTCQDNDACRCTADAKAQDLCTDDEICDLGRCFRLCTDAASCPQGQICDQGRCSDPPARQRFCEDSSQCLPSETCLEQRLFASHLEFGGYSDISLTQLRSLPSDSTERRELGLVKDATFKLPTAITGLSLFPNTSSLGGRGEILVSSRIDNRIRILPLQEEIPGSLPTLEIPLLNQTITRPDLADLRSLTIAENRKRGWVRMYVAARQPASILVYDVFRDTPDSDLRFSLVATLPLGGEAGQILYRHRPAPEPDLLYVVCSREGRVDVVDTESLRVLHQIKVGERPYFLTLYEPTPTSTFRQSRAYVTNFLDTTVSIIDLQTHRVIGLLKGIDTSLKVSP